MYWRYSIFVIWCCQTNYHGIICLYCILKFVGEIAYLLYFFSENFSVFFFFSPNIIALLERRTRQVAPLTHLPSYLKGASIHCHLTLSWFGFYSITLIFLIPYYSRMLTPASAATISGGFFCSAKKMTLMVVRWKLSLC